MNKKDKKRLAFLRMKVASELTSEELTELSTLVEKANAENIVLDADFNKKYASDSDEDDEDEDTVLGEKELTDIITKAVKEAKEGDESNTATVITKAITDALKGKSVDSATVDSIVKKHMDNNATDFTKMVAEFKTVLADHAKSQRGELFTKEQAQKMIDEALKKAEKSPSRMQHPTDSGLGLYAPCEYRGGNLTVAAKQLLNTLLMGTPKEVLEANGSKMPTGINDGITARDLKSAQDSGNRMIEMVRKAARYGGKALLTTSAGAGAELIPTDLSSDLQSRLYLESQLATALIASEIDMPTATYKLPLKTTRTKYYTQAEGADHIASDMGTAEIILSAQKLTGVASYSYEEDEDSIIPILPTLQQDMAEGAAASLEDAILNGHKNASHMDFDIAAVANHSAKLFDGIRRRILQSALTLDIDLSVGGISEANLLIMKGRMAKYGVKASDLLWIVGVGGYNTMLGLDNVQTVDKKGTGATINSGLLPSIFGSDIIYSEAVREDLASTGVNTEAGPNTKGSVFLVNKKYWTLGVRRGFTVETEVDKFKQLNHVIASFRRDFQPKDSLTTQPLAVMGRNY